MKDGWEWWYATFHWILNLPFSCLTVPYLFTSLSITLMFLATVHYSCRLRFTLDVNLFRIRFFPPVCLQSSTAPGTVTRERQDPRKGKEQITESIRWILVSRSSCFEWLRRPLQAAFRRKGKSWVLSCLPCLQHVTPAPVLKTVSCSRDALQSCS